MFKNFIAGEWVDGATRLAQHQSFGHARRRWRIRASRRRAGQRTPSPPPRRPRRLGPSARRSSASTSSTPPAAEILARSAELGDLLAREEGKTLPEAIGEVARAGNIFKFFAGEALRLGGESCPPCAPVSASRSPASPWASSASSRRGTSRSRSRRGRSRRRWPTATAWCSSRPISCPAAPGRIADILSRAGMPTGVFNLVMGRGSEVGAALLDDKRVDAITFTGSVATGARVAAGLRRAHGQVPARDGRQESARRAGRRRPRRRRQLRRSERVLLDRPALHRLVARSSSTEGIHDRFVAAMVEQTEALKVDDARKQGTDIGPVVDESQLEQDLTYVDIAQAGRRAGSRAAASASKTRWRARLLHDAGAVHRDDSPRCASTAKRCSAPW